MEAHALAPHVEALVFTAPQALPVEDIRSCLEAVFETPVSTAAVEEALLYLQEQYASAPGAIELVSIAGGYQFLTKPAFHHTVGTFLKQTTRKRLSQSALETLSIIAYKQPVSKTELEAIRGVGCDYALQKLLEKELVSITGRSEGPGRPLLYSTSEKFMDYFGLKSMKDLPKPRDFKTPDSEIGEAPAIDETIANQ